MMCKALLRVITSLALIGVAGSSWAGSLTGVVTDNSDAPIEAVMIQVVDSATSSIVATRNTALDGTYSVASLADGLYIIEATPPVSSGFAPATIPGVVVDGASIHDIVLVPQGVVTFDGIVTDRDGNPMENQCLTLRGSPFNYSDCTAADGTFSMTAPPDDYVLQLSGLTVASGTGEYARTSWSLTAGQLALVTNTTKAIVLPNVYLDVTVAEPGGSPAVPDARLSTRSYTQFTTDDLTFTGSVSGNANVGADGHEELFLLPTTYPCVSCGTDLKITAQPPADSPLFPAALDNLEVLTDGAVTVELASTVTFSATIVDRDGAPLSNQCVRLSGSAFGQSACTDASGALSVEVAPDDYYLGLSGHKYSSGTAGDYARTSWSLSGGQLPIYANVHKDIVLPNVYLELTTVDPVPNLVPNSRVTTRSYTQFTTDGLTFTGSVSGYANVGADGHEELFLLPTTYPCVSCGTDLSITAHPPTGAGLVPVRMEGLSLLVDSAVTVTLPYAVQFSFTVTDRDGNPMANQCIRLSSAFSFSGCTDAAGAASVDVSPGTLSLRLSGHTYAQSGSEYVRTSWSLAGGTIDVLADTHRDFVLPNVYLDTSVQDTFGSPVPNATLSTRSYTLFDTGGQSWFGWVSGRANVGADGAATFFMLPTTYPCDSCGTDLRVTVYPPTGSGYFPFQLDNRELLQDSALTIILELVPDDDSDDDGHDNDDDNCVGIANPDQLDTDDDGAGDACDGDDDDDGTNDDDDNCPLTPNADQGDWDGDGIGAACDPGDDPPNLPPTADAGPDQVLEAGPGCVAAATLDGSGSTDPDGDALSYDWTGPLGSVGAGVTLDLSLELGSHDYGLTVTDAFGETDGDDTTLIVEDTTPPDLTAPDTVVAECGAVDGTAVSLGDPEASDFCADPTVSNDAPATFDLGDTTVTWTAVDDDDNVATDTQLVSVVDTTPPEISSVVADPSELWPPNHKMVPVGLAAVASDLCGGDDAATCAITGIVSSDEPPNDIGDGNHQPDWEVTGDLTLLLRAERMGPEDGRVYTITVGCADAQGNASSAQVTVTVPHDQGP